jgi:hypothetical protein
MHGTTQIPHHFLLVLAVPVLAVQVPSPHVVYRHRHQQHPASLWLSWQSLLQHLLFLRPTHP